ncbi:putative AC transposase [Lactuca sativa]|uniref:putative AC transposase n=1 Tax=Lactuca sativa TaxID=4236 RepID=UPI0022AEA035|nr:putative AC transposase [Lactuca sativa]XP_042754073.2 putative AC transposase [Lactuca sativa]XP_052623325.1 putative AC transposase [Lactuca sativa]
MVDNWVDNNESTQFDDDEVFVDNTQQEINEEPTQKRKRVGKTRSDCWKSFEKIFIDGVWHGKCKWCERVLKANRNNTGTSSLNKHAKNCKQNPEKLKNQQTLQFKKEPTGEGSVSTWKHDDKRIKKAMLNLFVVGGLPFKFVENEVFIEYTNALNGKVVVPCRTTISKKVSLYYQEERNKLVTFLCNPLNTVHLTTDCWTSPSKRVHYIVITAHFIDDNWEMHKRIINFKELDSQRGEDIRKEVLKCIQGWGIKNVMTCTVDNASSNDKAIEFLKNKLPNLYNEGKHFHVRCMAHIINLIVRDGMNKNDESVKCLQDVVRYIRKSTQRIALFKKCMKAVGVESTKFLCNDCPTRWNSTYDLLKIAVDLEKAFYEYEMEDRSFARDVVTPVSENFVTCRAMVFFLEKFKVKTELVSTTSKPLANRFF